MSTPGRAKAAQLSLENDPHLSRHHFRLEVNPPETRLIDLDSRNGTFVNGSRVREIDLQDGDLISAGRSTLRFRAEAPTAAAKSGPATVIDAGSLDITNSSAKAPSFVPPLEALDLDAGPPMTIGGRHVVAFERGTDTAALVEPGCRVLSERCAKGTVPLVPCNQLRERYERADDDLRDDFLPIARGDVPILNPRVVMNDRQELHEDLIAVGNCR